ncbi:MAG: AAA family ATPase [Actinomycetes bacterium]
MTADRNPFRYAGPVGIDDLIDRDQETDTLLAAADEGNNARIAAPRRFGKTSLLRRVLGEAASDRWATVYVDFFGVVTLGDVAERVERAYAAGLTGPAARWFEAMRRTLRPSVKAGAPGVTAKVELDPVSAPLLERLELPRRVFDRWGTRVLVVFDEFQEVLTAQPNADAVIRSVIQHHSDAASYIFAGSHVGMMSELFTDRHRAFYTQARPVVLPPLPVPETAAFLDARFTGTGKNLGAALGPLLDATAGHPQRTMLLAHAVWDATPSGGAADEATVTLAQEQVLTQLNDEFRAHWSGLPATQRRLLTLVAEGATRPFSRGERGRSGGTRTALDALVARADLVVDSTTVSRYRVVDPMLASWLRAGRGEPS